MTVSRADSTIDWKDFQISWDTSGSGASLNGGATSVVNGAAIGSGIIHAGDYINVTYATTTIYQIRHVPTNSLIGTWTFAV